jgi:hypothetical protein
MSKFFNALAVAVLGIALLMGVSAATTISGNVAESIEISVTPDGITNFALNPGTTPTHTGTLSVNANKAWTVTAAADSATGHTKGYMSKFGSGLYSETEVKLSSPMSIKSDDTGYTNLAALTSDRAIAAGTTSEAGITVTFSQPVAWSDAVLSTPYNYQIIVTYTYA